MSDLRNQLLAAGRSGDDDEIRAALEEQFGERERKFRRNSWITKGTYAFLIVLVTAFLMLGGRHPGTPMSLWFGILAVFWLCVGALFINQMWHDRNRLELRRELARLELLIRHQSEE